jgi:hypothetical protein
MEIRSRAILWWDDIRRISRGKIKPVNFCDIILNVDFNPDKSAEGERNG